MKRKLINDIKEDINKLIKMYDEEDIDKLKILTSILKLKEIISLTSDTNYKLPINKNSEYYKYLLMDYINLIKENKEIKKLYDKNVFVEFYNNNFEFIKEHSKNNEYYSIINNNEYDINMFNKISTNFSKEYHNFVNTNIKNIYIVDNINNINIDGFTNIVEQLNKSYCISISSIYILYHELTHLYQEHNSNYNNIITNNLFDEMFPYSIELIIGKLLKRNYKDLIIFNLYNLCNDMIKFYKKTSINDIKSFIGSICGMKLCELYFNDSEKYFNYMNLYSKNFMKFQTFDDLKLIEINKEELISKSLVKNFVANY